MERENIMSDAQLRQNIIDELDFEPSIDAAHIASAAAALVEEGEQPQPPATD